MVIFWWLFIITSVVIARIPYESDFRDFTGVEATMRKIIKSCYSDYGTPNPIFILGDIDNVIDESIFDTRSVSIIAMKDSVDLNGNNGAKLWDFEPKMIILAGDSPKQLQSDLLSLRRTRWWNYKAHFFILGRIQNQCKRSSEILSITSKMDILMSVYICLNPQNITELYTVNPITNYALPPWEKIESSKDLKIYRQLFDPNISCRNLGYDKTIFLNGYQIKAVMLQPMTGISELKTEKPFVGILGEFQINLFQTISNILNASFVYGLEPSRHSSKERVANGSADVLLDVLPMYFYPDMQFLSSYLWTPIVAVRKPDRQLSALEKINDLWSVRIRILAMVTLSIFFIVLVRVKTEISSAMLEIIRLLTYVSIRTTPKRLSFRIFFGAILILVVISNGIFQGSISAFLTKPQYARGIDTLKELEELKYIMYVPSGTGNQIAPYFQNNTVIEIPTMENIKCLFNTSQSVFLTIIEMYYQRWSHLEVTLVKEPVTNTYFNNKYRDGWPLHQRVDTILMRLVEAGLTDYWHKEKSHIPRLKRRAYDMGLLTPAYQPVELKALDFAFQLLAVGLALATVVLFLEIICKLSD